MARTDNRKQGRAKRVKIWVTPLSRLPATLEVSGARRLVTLLNEGTPFQRPAGIAAGNHLMLAMHDIICEAPGMTAPGRHHVEAFLHFVHEWDRHHPLVIHCFAGISRSTAAAYIAAVALGSRRDPADWAQLLRRLAPQATPNIRLVEIADELLGHGGRMSEAIRAIGRGAEAFEGMPFALTLDEISADQS
jgi:predicted protein tyrosine phosphatase